MTNTLSTNSNKELSSDFDVDVVDLLHGIASIYVSKMSIISKLFFPFHGTPMFLLHFPFSSYLFIVRTLFPVSASTFISNESRLQLFSF